MSIFLCDSDFDIIDLCNKYINPIDIMVRQVCVYSYTEMKSSEIENTFSVFIVSIFS